MFRETPPCSETENGASRARTGDLLGAIQALFQLSYSPARPIREPISGRKSHASAL